MTNPNNLNKDSESTDSSTKELLTKLRDQLAETDPGVLELDIDDPDTALALILTAAILKGNSVSLQGESEDGRIETLDVTHTGTDTDGNPIISATFTDSTGQFSENAAEAIAIAAQPQIEQGFERLLGDVPPEMQ